MGWPCLGVLIPARRRLFELVWTSDLFRVNIGVVPAEAEEV